MSRLEELKKYIDYLDDSADMEDNARLIATLESLYRDGVLDDILRYAKEQAERVQELEKENKRLEDFIETIQNVHFVELQREKAENRRYREALEFYADEETYEEVRHEAVYQGGEPIDPPSGEPPLIYYDKGQEARKALGESK